MRCSFIFPKKVLVSNINMIRVRKTFFFSKPLTASKTNDEKFVPKIYVPFKKNAGFGSPNILNKNFF